MVSFPDWRPVGGAHCPGCAPLLRGLQPGVQTELCCARVPVRQPRLQPRNWRPEAAGYRWVRSSLGGGGARCLSLSLSLCDPHHLSLHPLPCQGGVERNREPFQPPRAELRGHQRAPAQSLPQVVGRRAAWGEWIHQSWRGIREHSQGGSSQERRQSTGSRVADAGKTGRPTQTA